jgi:hypothetical protein
MTMGVRIGGSRNGSPHPYNPRVRRGEGEEEEEKEKEDDDMGSEQGELEDRSERNKAGLAG